MTNISAIRQHKRGLTFGNKMAPGPILPIPPNTVLQLEDLPAPWYITNVLLNVRLLELLRAGHSYVETAKQLRLEFPDANIYKGCVAGRIKKLRLLWQERAHEIVKE